MSMEADSSIAVPEPLPASEAAVRPTGRAPVAFALCALVCGAIALYEWWEYVGGAAVGMGVGAALIAIGRGSGRRWLTRTGWTLGILAFGFGALVLALCGLFQIGYPSRDRWPSELGDMVQAASLDPDSVRVQCLNKFMFDSTYVWKLELGKNDAVEVA